MSYRDGRYAAIDIGTVTTRMMIADIEDGELTVLSKQYAVTNLGLGVDTSHRLQPDAMERVREAISQYLTIRDSYQTSGIPITTIALATSAARDAENSSEFIQMLAGLGLKLTVIPGSTEAILTFKGISGDFPGESLMAVDIGGGSTELAIGDAGSKPLAFRSFDIGCRRVTERYMRMDPPDSQEIADAHAWVRQELKPFFDALWEQRQVPEKMVAVAGTATSVVSIRDHMNVYDSARVHKSVVTFEELHTVTETLSSLDLKQRKKVVGLDPNRAPVIVAGLIILEEVFNAAALNSFIVSESDILNGMIYYAAGLS